MPVPIVPSVVTFVVPAHVDIAVFSTLFKLKSVLTSATSSPIIPFAVNLAYSPVAVPLPSISTALLSAIPNVNALCFAFHVAALAT